MFVLYELKDRVKIHPQFFPKNPHDPLPFITAITTELSRKYAQKVLKNLGFVLFVHEILEIGDMLIHMNDEGSACPIVRFQLCVWTPVRGDTMDGFIKSMDSSYGIQVSLSWFDDIFLPSESLLETSSWDSDHNCWVWHYDSEQTYQYSLRQGIRFKVENIRFQEDLNRSPMVVFGQIKQLGLGPIQWWRQNLLFLKEESENLIFEKEN